jgi:PhoPQ-activated pathogenicity-related protein
MINGTNDQYWVVDAMKLYWSDLVGPKFVLQVPNAGHGLGGGGNRVGATLAAFFRHVVQGRDFPKINWKAVEEDSKYGLQLHVTPNPQTVKFWRAHSASGDFRESRWSSEPMAKSANGFVGWVEKPANGQHVAYFGELEFEADGQSYWLSTVIQRH